MTEFKPQEQAPSTATMSTLYNKVNEGSLIGNWVEEKALRELTGTSRYEVHSALHRNISECARWSG